MLDALLLFFLILASPFVLIYQKYQKRRLENQQRSQLEVLYDILLAALPTLESALPATRTTLTYMDIYMPGGARPSTPVSADTLPRLIERGQMLVRYIAQHRVTDGLQLPEDLNARIEAYMATHQSGGFWDFTS